MSLSLALVTQRTAIELCVVVVFALLLLTLWSKLDRREKRRRVERKERQAAYERSRIRTEKEWDDAQRYLGGVVR